MTKINLSPAEQEKIKRALLFVPCESEEHLHNWIKAYLGIDLPNCTVCDDDTTTDPSNSNPMRLIYEIYVKALDGQDPNFQKLLAFAARDSFKTLSAAIIEVLCLFHLRRNVAHMAAIESQAQKCQQYVEKFLQRPILRDYLTSKNKRTIEITRYEDNDGKIISPVEYEQLPFEERGYFTPKSNYMKILIATLQGANSEHVPFMVLDELDLAPPGPIEEAKMIPAQGEERGELPITFMTSSRKFAFGLVQKEIDRADKTGLNIRHWNIIDVTKACPPERHLPEEPKIPLYYSEETLNSITEDDYNLLSTEEQTKYYKAEGYAGCLRNCSLFAVCRGRLATKQKSTSKMLKGIDKVIGLFKDVSPEIAKAQLMCWKPSSQGLIYPHFNKKFHMLSPAEMAEKITGETYHPSFSKSDLIHLMRSRNMSFYSGMDFGFTHNFSVVTGAVDGNRLFVFDVIAVPQLEIQQKIDLCKGKIQYLDPVIFPDPAYPADIKTFKRHGFKCKNFTKDVLQGINAVRMKLMPGLNKPPEIFFLKNDPGVELLCKRLGEYHWVIDDAGNPTNVPDEENDDECDALRYLCQNLFGGKGKIALGLGDGSSEQEQQQAPVQRTTNDWMSKKIRELTDGNGERKVFRGKRGSFFFEF